MGTVVEDQALALATLRGGGGHLNIKFVQN